MKISKLLSLLFVLLTLSPAAHATDWKGLFVAGDDSIDNFDHGREDVTAMFSRMGHLVSSVQLSSSERYIGGDVYVANAHNLVVGFNRLQVKDGEGCLVHLTSHGAHGQGFYLSQAGILPPGTLAQLVNKACGDHPTVILVSACYSGQFITDALKGDNRVILTAAEADRPSFGCSADTRYTYWDECLLSEVPHTRTWPEAYEHVKSCISHKEAELGAKPSNPQGYFGKNTAAWQIMQ